MSEITPCGEQFQKVVDIIEAARERAYQKVNEELILLYRDIGAETCQRQWYLNII